jgi:hypothetical protein
VVKRSVFGSVPDDEQMQEARRKQRRLVEEADRAHMRTFGITPPEELARKLWEEYRGTPMPEERVRDLRESLRNKKPDS